METKHTKEYAEKLAKENVVYGESLGNYVFGYMKAIEETAAPELLEALNKITIAYKQHCDKPSIKLILEAEQLIKKATE